MNWTKPVVHEVSGLCGVIVKAVGKRSECPGLKSHFCQSSFCYRPQRSWGKVMFLHVCVILFTGGPCVVAGGCVWLLGGVHGCWGACMVAGGHAWLLGGCVWLWGGMCGCWGACVVARGCAWLLGGMCGCWGAWLPGGCCGSQGAYVVARGHA